jgi:ATP-binding cassette subfamily G (WHITE) protein 2 (SNQ2)
MLLFVTEFNTGSAFDSAVTLFKQGPRSVGPASVRRDEEKARPPREGGYKKGNAFGEETPAPPDIFTWHHVHYVVPISGGQERRLLDNVSGYVAPGKLTALMGESGAGKVDNCLTFNLTVNLQNGARPLCSMSLLSELMLVLFQETVLLTGNHFLQTFNHRRT